MADLSGELSERVAAAHAARRALRIVGGDTKAFYGRAVGGEPLATSDHRGIVSYEPTELVVRARGGTPLAELEATLADAGQMLAFEPPHFGAGATLGGTIACGLSGPRRPFAGAARDFVLGATIANGRGARMRFGGEVMKNVAGYDVSRLMTGALGTLGVLLDVSLKVLPRPETEATLVHGVDAGEAVARFAEWCGRALPLSGAMWTDGALHARVSGSEQAVRAACERLGGDRMDGAEADAFWRALREHTLPFFAGDLPLWRISLPPASPPLELPGRWCYDWAGAQRWLSSDAGPASVRGAAADAGGHATLFRGGDRDGEVFHPLAAPLAGLHRRLKDTFDPAGVLNPGRMYVEL